MLPSALDMGIFSDPFTFATAVGLTAAIVLFLWYFYKVISKYA